MIAYSVYVARGARPCDPGRKHKGRGMFVLLMIEAIKSIAFTGPLITIICRSVTKIKRQVSGMIDVNRTQEMNERLQESLRKVNISYMYGATFLLFWIPFLVIAAFSKKYPYWMYRHMINLGYTVALGFTAVLPILFVATDKHFSVKKSAAYESYETNNTQINVST